MNSRPSAVLVSVALLSIVITLGAGPIAAQSATPPPQHRSRFPTGQPAWTPAQKEFYGAVDRFNQYSSALQPKVKNASNMPFLLTHGTKAARSILMVHGLTDSPYYMRALADVFYNQGYNVVGILLPGHGTNPNDLLNVKLSEWRQAVQFGVNVAASVGDEVSIGGFSTGGALALDAVVQNYATQRPRKLGDVFLFSPAVQIADEKANIACNMPELAVWIQKWASGGPDTSETNPYNYNSMATNAVCQLYRLTVQNYLTRVAFYADLERYGIGLFAVESLADDTVKPNAVLGLVDGLSNDLAERFLAALSSDNPGANLIAGLPSSVRRKLILYPKDEAIQHAAVTRPESNPHYDQLQSEIREFIAARPSAVTPSKPLAPIKNSLENSPALKSAAALSAGQSAF